MEQNVGQNEQDLQRFLQIREEIHKEIEKIPLTVLQLQEVSNRFVGQFKVFESLTQSVQVQVKATIKNAAFEMAEMASEEFTKCIETQVQNTLGNLDQSVSEARSILESISQKNTLKTITIVTLLVLLSLLIGFGLGIFYNERKTYSLAKEFLKPINGKKSPRK